MLVDSMGDVTITNDGATMLKELDVQHPAAKMMVEISKATDNEVGDGTTSAVVMAGALLEKAEDLINKDVHPVVVVDGYSRAAEKAQRILEDDGREGRPREQVRHAEGREHEHADEAGERRLPSPCRNRRRRDHQVAEKRERRLQGGHRQREGREEARRRPDRHTKLIQGIVLDKEVVHSGMPRKIDEAKIALVNSALEIEKTEFSAEIRINDPQQMQQFMDEETSILKGMVEKVAGGRG